MEVALGGVQPALLPDACPRGEEVPQGWFVRADLLGGDDQIEPDAEVTQGAGEEIPAFIRR